MITAHEIRAFAQANGIPVSKRGPVSHAVLVAFLRANPSITRRFAREHGIPVGSRGRMSADVFETVAGVL